MNLRGIERIRQVCKILFLKTNYISFLKHKNIIYWVNTSDTFNLVSYFVYMLNIDNINTKLTFIAKLSLILR